MDWLNKWIDGKKTIIGGIGIILTAIGTYFSSGLASHGFNIADLLAFLKVFSAGMITLGFGGKLQKLLEALQDSK